MRFVWAIYDNDGKKYGWVDVNMPWEFVLNIMRATPADVHAVLEVRSDE